MKALNFLTKKQQLHLLLLHLLPSASTATTSTDTTANETTSTASAAENTNSNDLTFLDYLNSNLLKKEQCKIASIDNELIKGHLIVRKYFDTVKNFGYKPFLSLSFFGSEKENDQKVEGFGMYEYSWKEKNDFGVKNLREGENENITLSANKLTVVDNNKNYDINLSDLKNINVMIDVPVFEFIFRSKLNNVDKPRYYVSTIKKGSGYKKFNMSVLDKYRGTSKEIKLNSKIFGNMFNETGYEFYFYDKDETKDIQYLKQSEEDVKITVVANPKLPNNLGIFSFGPYGFKEITSDNFITLNDQNQYNKISWLGNDNAYILNDDNILTTKFDNDILKINLMGPNRRLNHKGYFVQKNNSTSDLKRIDVPGKSNKLFIQDEKICYAIYDDYNKIDSKTEFSFDNLFYSINISDIKEKYESIPFTNGNYKIIRYYDESNYLKGQMGNATFRIYNNDVTVIDVAKPSSSPIKLYTVYNKIFINVNEETNLILKIYKNSNGKYLGFLRDNSLVELTFEDLSSEYLNLVKNCPICPVIKQDTEQNNNEKINEEENKQDDNQEDKEEINNNEINEEDNDEEDDDEEGSGTNIYLLIILILIVIFLIRKKLKF